MGYADDFQNVHQQLNDFLGENKAGDVPVIHQMKMSELVRKLDIEALIETGGLREETLSQFMEDYLKNCFRIQHPKNMGHQVSVPHMQAVVGAHVDAVTNNPMAIYEKGPAAATIEYAVLNWMLKKIGWTPAPYVGEAEEPFEHGAGVLTHGGSLAQLTALAAARSAADPQAWENGVNSDLVVIASPKAHYSVSRAIGILGMGTNAVISPECDEFGLIQPEKLEQLIESLKSDGKKIMAVVAIAGCTAAGLYDDLSTIGDICLAHDIWFHVDGAHGASALLSSSHQHYMTGIDKATSMIWDAHKMMRAPGLCAAVLFKRYQDADRAFSQQASYLFHDKDQLGFDAMTRTVECTKAGLGLKFFMGLAAEGEKEMGAYVAHCFDFAHEIAEMIKAHPSFELAVQPQANIVCFRHVAGEGDLQLELRKRLLATGRGYITSTELGERRWLRFTFMNPETKKEDVREILDLLDELAS